MDTELQQQVGAAFINNGGAADQDKNVESYEIKIERHTNEDSSSQYGVYEQKVVEKVVEVPVVQFKEVPVVKVVEVPEVQTDVVIKEVEIPVPTDLPIIMPRQAPVEQEMIRNVPKPVDVVTYQGYVMPKLKAKYYDVEVKIYVPRYIEVPVPTNFITYDPKTARKFPPATIDQYPSHMSFAPLVKDGEYIDVPSTVTGSFAPVVPATYEESLKSPKSQCTNSPYHGISQEEFIQKMQMADNSSQISRSNGVRSRRSSIQSHPSSFRSEFIPPSPTFTAGESHFPSVPVI